MKQTVVLVVLDGWGVGSRDASNPIYAANPQSITYFETYFRAGALQASGPAVGLPWEEEGNSEVGHLTLGAGKIIYQHFPKISATIEDGSFYSNPALKKAFTEAKERGTALHLVGLLSEGNVHASFAHLAALLELGKREGVSKVYLQLFLDGRDSPPRGAGTLLKKLARVIEETGCGTIASLAGRYYGMDRDEHWERTESAYKILVGTDTRTDTADHLLSGSYADNISDEYMVPTVIGEPHPIADGDSVVFFNFREDRMREIVAAFVDPAFSKFPVKKFERLAVTTMTAYRSDFKVPVAFPTETVKNPLGKVLADDGRTQLRVAETEKYAHVTYFFNGLREEPFENEFRVLIPSQRIARHDEHPEMMSEAVTDRVLASLSESAFDFILVNYANPDIIAHTGNFEATVKAIQTVDRELLRLADRILADGHILIITSDHGNAETILNSAGNVETKHNIAPVPVYLVGNEFARSAPHQGFFEYETIGILADVAPTILELMRIQKPPDMTGTSLVSQLGIERS